jgi:hypothetical protein
LWFVPKPCRPLQSKGLPGDTLRMVPHRLIDWAALETEASESCSTAELQAIQAYVNECVATSPSSLYRGMKKGLTDLRLRWVSRTASDSEESEYDGRKRRATPTSSLSADPQPGAGKQVSS